MPRNDEQKFIMLASLLSGIAKVAEIISPLDKPISVEEHEQLNAFAMKMWQERVDNALNEVMRFNKGLDISALKLMLGFRHIQGTTLDELKVETEALLEEARVRLVRLVDLGNAKHIALQKRYIKALESGLRELLAFSDAVEKVLEADPSIELTDEEEYTQFKYQAAGAVLGGVLALLASPVTMGFGAIAGVFQTGIDTKNSVSTYIADKRYMFAVGSVVGGIVMLPFKILRGAKKLPDASVVLGAGLGAHLTKRRQNQVYKHKCNLLYSILMLQDVLDKSKTKSKRMPKELQMPTGITKYFSVLYILNLSSKDDMKDINELVEQITADFATNKLEETRMRGLSLEHSDTPEDNTHIKEDPTMTLRLVADELTAREQSSDEREQSNVHRPASFRGASTPPLRHSSSSSLKSADAAEPSQHVERIPSGFWRDASSEASEIVHKPSARDSMFDPGWTKFTRTLEARVNKINAEYQKETFPAPSKLFARKTAASRPAPNLFRIQKNIQHLIVTENDTKHSMQHKLLIERNAIGIQTMLPSVWFKENKSRRIPSMRKSKVSKARDDMIKALLDAMNDMPNQAEIIISNCSNGPAVAIKLHKMALARGLLPKYDAYDGTQDAVDAYLHNKKKRRAMF